MILKFVVENAYFVIKKTYLKLKIIRQYVQKINTVFRECFFACSREQKEIEIQNWLRHIKANNLSYQMTGADSEKDKEGIYLPTNVIYYVIF